MQAKNKQRLVGVLILLAILAIFFPLLFHNSHPSTSQLSVRIPLKPIKPRMDTVQVRIGKPAQGGVIAQQSASPVKKVELLPPKSGTKSEPKTESHSPSQVMHALSKAQLKKAKAVTTSEQKGLNEFISQPKAWTVQLGTFHNAKNAKRLIRKLRQKGFDAYTRSIVDANGNHLMRVYVGPEIRRESALQLKNKLQTTFHIRGVVRKYKIKT